MAGYTLPFPDLSSSKSLNQGQDQQTIPMPHSSAEMAAAALGAATPSATQHSTAIPYNLQPHVKSFTPAPLNKQPAPIGKGNARGQGIGNAIIGVANAITGIETADSNKKQLQVATDTQTLLTSQSAIDSASSIQPGEPGYEKAQDTIKHNKDIMNGILSDDKTRKAIAKGMKIDFTDPQANKTPEHKAVQQGQQMAEKSASQQSPDYADQFAKGIPQQQAPNQAAIAKYQQMQADNKAQLEFAKAVAPAQIRAASQSAVEAARISSQLTQKQAEITLGWNKMIQEQNFKVQNMATEQKNAITKIWTEGAKQKSVEQARINALANDPNSVVKAADQSENEWSEIANRTQNQIAKYRNDLLTTKDETQKRNLSSAIETLNNTLEEQKKQQGQSQMYWTVKKQALGLAPSKVEGLDNGRSNSTTPSSNTDSSSATKAITGYQGAAYLNIPDPYSTTNK